jgi:hypothetical protein
VALEVILAYGAQPRAGRRDRGRVLEVSRLGRRQLPGPITRPERRAVLGADPGRLDRNLPEVLLDDSAATAAAAGVAVQLEVTPECHTSSRPLRVLGEDGAALAPAGAFLADPHQVGLRCRAQSHTACPTVFLHDLARAPGHWRPRRVERALSLDHPDPATTAHLIRREIIQAE